MLRSDIRDGQRVVKVYGNAIGCIISPLRANGKVFVRWPSGLGSWEYASLLRIQAT